MVDCALYVVEELMRNNKECLLYGQDVGRRLASVFRENPYRIIECRINCICILVYLLKYPQKYLEHLGIYNVKL